MGNKVIELAETGLLDGQEVAIPEGLDIYTMMEKSGLDTYKVEWGDTGRRNQRTGFRIYERVSRELVSHE